MTDSEAIRIVERHQAWQRGAEMRQMPCNVIELGQALDRVIELARRVCPKKQRHKACNGIGCSEWVHSPAKLCPACLARLARVSFAGVRR